MSVKQLRKTIDGYLVELEIRVGDDPPSDCTITRKIGSKLYWHSLAALENTGYLIDSNGTDEQDVPVGTIQKISEWAEQNGY